MPAHESETIVFNFGKLLSTLPNYTELEQMLLFSANWGKQVCKLLHHISFFKAQLINEGETTGISKDKNVMARTRKYYLKKYYLTLRSKVKVPQRSLWFATHRYVSPSNEGRHIVLV
jgi:hypothetical protein